MRKVDVVIIGSGFAGSIMAMILRRLGRSVLMLERGKHPRFAIGESSTPLANLLLEELGQRYHLPDLATFSKWGTWQAAHPEIACGLKRGFTFYKHEFGREVDFADRTRQLLVAASPHDRIADTHWYRPDFDTYLARRARAMGAELFEEAKFALVWREEEDWTVHVQAPEPFSVDAEFLIDASGPRGCLWRDLKLDAWDDAWTPPRDNFLHKYPKTEALYAHFEDVRRVDFADPALPFPPDDAAVHHVFDGGWIWILRFNNGITSAGASVTKKLAAELNLREGAAAWERLLQKLPTLHSLFANAKPVTKFIHQPEVAFATMPAHYRWALLPSAAGFVDPLFSTGFVLALLGISRLAKMFETGSANEAALATYAQATLRELNQTGTLVGAAFQAFDRFDEFAEIARVYFASALWSETLRRLERDTPAFLFANDPEVVSMVKELRAGRGATEREHFLAKYDLGGLSDRSRHNWHPALAGDLFANAHKIPATAAEIEAMLRKCGF